MSAVACLPRVLAELIVAYDPGRCVFSVVDYERPPYDPGRLVSSAEPEVWSCSDSVLRASFSLDGGELESPMHRWNYAYPRAIEILIDRPELLLCLTLGEPSLRKRAKEWPCPAEERLGCRRWTAACASHWWSLGQDPERRRAVRQERHDTTVGREGKLRRPNVSGVYALRERLVGCYTWRPASGNTWYTREILAVIVDLAAIRALSRLAH